MHISIITEVNWDSFHQMATSEDCLQDNDEQGTGLELLLWNF